MAFGVVLPDDLGSTPAPSPTPEPEIKEEAAPASTAGEDGSWEGDKKDLEVSKAADKSEAPKEYLDLDKLERFRFAGRDWSPKDLRNAYLRHEDYTRKTQELSEARKYSDNFTADLQTVIDNPNRISEFRGVYPKAYVDAAMKILNRINATGTAPKEQSDTTRPANDPLLLKLSSLEEKFLGLEQEKFHGEVEQIQSWLDNQFETLQKKYPYANPEVVTARAEILSKQGTEISKENLDKLFKINDGEIKGQWEKMYKGKVQEQIKAGSKAKDTGVGGGIPGAAPKGYKTFKEATAAAIADIEARRSAI